MNNCPGTEVCNKPRWFDNEPWCFECVRAGALDRTAPAEPEVVETSITLTTTEEDEQS